MNKEEIIKIEQEMRSVFTKEELEEIKRDLERLEGDFKKEE